MTIAIPEQSILPEHLALSTRGMFHARSRPTGPWEAAARYNPTDLVSYEGATYICLTYHRSSSNFIADRDSLGRWMIFSTVNTSVAVDAAAAAAASALQAANAAVAAGGSEADAEAAQTAAEAAQVAAEAAEAGIESALSSKADIDSPVFTGTPTAPTPAKTDSDTSLATTGFVKVRETWINAYDHVTDPLQSDWTAYIDAAIAELPSGGGCVKMPVGNVPLASNLAEIANKHVRLEGHGRDITRLLHRHATQSCIRFNHSTAGWNSEVLSLSIIADGVLCTERAISLTLPAVYTEQTHGSLFRDIAIKGTTWATDGFTYGVYMSNGFRAMVENCSFVAKQLTTDMCGVFITGAGTKEPSLRRCGQVYGYALLKGDAGGQLMEGVQVTDCDAVATNWLAHIEDADNGPDWKIHDNHAQTFLGGVHLENAAQFFSRGNTFYKRAGGVSGEPAVAAWTPYDLSGVQQWFVENNFAYVVVPSEHAGDVFLRAVNSDKGRAAFNQIEGFDVAFDLNGTSDAVVTLNSYADCSLFASNVPSTATVKNNYPLSSEGVVQFGGNDTTPSVGNVFSRSYRTANSGATTVTNFDDGFNGQEFTLLVNDANTTIQHNAGLIMRGGVDATPATGALFQFLRDGTAWREVSRSY